MSTITLKCGLVVTIADGSSIDLLNSATYLASCAESIVDSVIDAANDPEGQQWTSCESIAGQLYGLQVLQEMATACFIKAVDTAKKGAKP